MLRRPISETYISKSFGPLVSMVPLMGMIMIGLLFSDKDRTTLVNIGDVTKGPTWASSMKSVDGSNKKYLRICFVRPGFS